MKTFTKRVATGAAVVAGIVGLAAGVGFAAAPLSDAHAGNGEASATAAGLPGVVTVNDTHAEGSFYWGGTGNVSYLTVADQNLIGRDYKGNWNGALPAGDVVDTVNSLTCGTQGVIVPVGADKVVLCANVLPGGTSQGQVGGAYGALADATVVSDGDTLPNTGTAAVVAPSSAATYYGCSGSQASVAEVYSTLAGSPILVGQERAQRNCEAAN